MVSVSQRRTQHTVGLISALFAILLLFRPILHYARHSVPQLGSTSFCDFNSALQGTLLKCRTEGSSLAQAETRRKLKFDKRNQGHHRAIAFRCKIFPTQSLQLNIDRFHPPFARPTFRKKALMAHIPYTIRASPFQKAIILTLCSSDTAEEKSRIMFCAHRDESLEALLRVLQKCGQSLPLSSSSLRGKRLQEPKQAQQ